LNVTGGVWRCYAICCRIEHLTCWLPCVVGIKARTRVPILRYHEQICWRTGRTSFWNNLLHVRHGRHAWSAPSSSCHYRHSCLELCFPFAPRHCGIPCRSSTRSPSNAWHGEDTVRSLNASGACRIVSERRRGCRALSL
jgi:hypothetical protein